MNVLEGQTLQNANDEVIYNVYAYLASRINEKTGSTFRELINQLETEFARNGADWSEHDRQQLLILFRIRQKSNADILDAKLVAKTEDPDGLNAFVFEKPNGDVSVVFRGTAAGEWIDNGEGLDGLPESNDYVTYGDLGKVVNVTTKTVDYSTDQQVGALNWFNKIASVLGWDEDTHITVSGHSKGGNKAQYVTINSGLVDDCYSFDGQGYSPEAQKMFREEYGELYNERRAKIKCIAAVDDYVNVLGERIALPENVYFVEAPGVGINVVDYHYVDVIINDVGELNESCAQGGVSQYIQKVSEEMMKLDPEHRKYVTLGIMNIAQFGLGGGTPVNGDHVSWETTVVGTIIGIGYAMETGGTMLGENGADKLKDIYNNFWEELNSKDSIIGKIGYSLQALGETALGVIMLGGGFALDKLGELVSGIGERLKEWGVAVSGFVKTIVSGLTNWYNKNFNAGYKYATSNPFVQLNTASLRNYAQRLQSVNNRVSSLDRRMDSLYWKVGLQGLWDLMQADILTGYSWRISRCVSYLNEIATDFENVERELRAQL